MPSFDIVCDANIVEVKNAVDQANKEVSTRFDFKGSDARITYQDHSLMVFADDDFKLAQVRDILIAKLAKRQVDVRFLQEGKKEKISGDKLKETIMIKKGINNELAKTLVKIIKNSKLKVQTQIQGDSVRVNSAKRDELQAAIALLREQVEQEPLTFENFRE